MPVRRDADGNIIDEQTRLIRRPGLRERAGDDLSEAPTERSTADIAGGGGFPEPAREEGPRDADRYSAPTTPVRDHAAAPDSTRTRLYRPNQPVPPSGHAAEPANRSAGAGGDPMADPPVGWLVIVDGPGRGQVATLGIGVNSIGRDPTERVSLDYGDTMLSRANHCAITYDPRGKKFYVQHGGGTNLTYANDEPVLAPRELEPLTHVQMGNTVLRFVPLCGTGFSWDDEGGGRDARDH